MPSKPVKVPAELKAAVGTFKVQKKQCSTCIYREGFAARSARKSLKQKSGMSIADSKVTCASATIAKMPAAGASGTGARITFPAGRSLNGLGLVEYVIDDDWESGEETDA